MSRGRKLGRSWQIAEGSTDHGDKTNQAMFKRRVMLHLHPVIGGPLLARANSRIAARTFARMLMAIFSKRERIGFQCSSDQDGC